MTDGMTDGMTEPLPLRVPPAPVDLAAIDPSSTPGFDGGKAAGKEALSALGDELSDLQERLFAEGRTGGRRSVLLVLQGMDTSGKGGTVRRTVGLLDPQGVHIKAFAAPTPDELAHDFLWRIERELPPAGRIGVFDRSHYEDVLVPRVRGLVPPAELERRYAAINDFERRLVEGGTTVVKCLLHISADEQRERLLARLDDPAKHWKFSPGDIDDRARWSDYQDAYRVLVERTSTDVAPWHVVPADRKWYRDLAVGTLLLHTLRGLDLRWPEADFDVAEQRSRLERQGPVA